MSGVLAMSSLLESMLPASLAPLWQVYDRIVLREPQGVETSQHWGWTTLRPLVDRSVSAVAGDDADHRVLLLQHRELGGRLATTPTLLAGVQCVLPGEQTAPHRHTASAVRFVLESDGACTFVDGKGCAMRPGDVVITPNWTWHSHSNPTTLRAVWLDILDAPAMGLLGSTFGARGGAQEYASTLASLPDAAYAQGGLSVVSEAVTPPYSPRLHWRAADVQATLEHAPPRSDGSRLVRYTNPVGGGSVMETLDIYTLALRRSQRTTPYRTTASAVCVVAEGEGQSEVGDCVHRWSQHDVFTLPRWTWASHCALSESARLVIVSDRELYRKLGLIREERLIDS